MILLQLKPLAALRARGLILAALAVLVLFAHGCHGDEDNELFAPLVRSRPAASVVHVE